MKKWQQITLWILGTVAARVYGMIYVDVVMRRQRVLPRREKNTGTGLTIRKERVQFPHEKFANDKAGLDQQLAKGKLAKEDYDRQLELASVRS